MRAHAYEERKRERGGYKETERKREIEKRRERERERETSISSGKVACKSSSFGEQVISAVGSTGRRRSSADTDPPGLPPSSREA